MLEFIASRWLITFKNKKQMYDVLGLSDRYNPECETIEPAEKKAQLIKELLGGEFDRPVYVGSRDIPIFELNEIGQDVIGIKYGDRIYPGKLWGAILDVLTCIISADPTRIDEYCDVKEARRRVSTFTKEKPNSDSYVEICGINVYLGNSRSALETLKKVITIYGIDPNSVYVMKRR